MAVEQRHDLLAAAIRWSALSVAWAVVVGASSLIAGVVASSLALIGLGANSILDGSASSVLIWRFRHERSPTADVEAVERRAGVAVGAVMGAVAVYLAVSGVKALVGHSTPAESVVGIVLAGASAVVLPLLARAKLRLAAPLGSPALRGDGMLSLAGGVLASAALVSLVLEAALDWWWADGVAALLIAGMLATEGARTARHARDRTVAPNARG